MTYYVTIKDGQIDELFDSANNNVPQGATAIAGAHGEALRRMPSFSDYALVGGVPTLSIPLARVKLARKAVMDAARDAAMSAGFIHSGVLWHCDALFQAQVQGFVLAYTTGTLGPTATVSIRSKNNATNQLGLAAVSALAAALMAHVQGIYANSWVKKDTIDAATTANDVNAVAW